jgi:hypothetical protein
VKKEWRLVDGVNDHAADGAVWDGFLSRATAMDALEEDARHVAAKLNLTAFVASR